MPAGETVSVRIPPGAKEELKAATGMAFSTVVRTIVMALLAYYREERRQNEARELKREASSKIEEITNAVVSGKVPLDDE